MNNLEWIIYLAMLLASSVTGGPDANGIDIYSFPSPLYLETGSPFTVTCSHPVDVSYLHWEHPTDGVISDSRGRFVIQKRTNEVSLVIQSALESDGGNYRCVLRRGAAIFMSNYVPGLYRLRIETHIPNGNRTVSAGDNLTLSCNASNVDFMQWIMVTPRLEVVSNTQDGRIFITPNFQLQFRGILLEDEGVYRCSLRNDLGSDSIVTNIKVVVRPVTSISPAFLEVEEGEAISITCHIIGFPLPAITWRDVTNRIITDSTEGLTVNTATQNSTSLISRATFASVQKGHTGTYTCRAFNSYGDHSSTVFLRLAGSPDPPSNVVLNILNFTNILVTWDSLPSEVDTYAVTWEALNGRTTSKMTVTLSNVMETRYVIANLERLTLYSVSVYATNSNGMGMASSPMLITTSATFPGVPLDVIILDVGPSSVRVEWSGLTLPTDDGGSRIRTVRLTYRPMNEEVWSDDALVVDVGLMFAILPGLRDRTTYQIRMQVGNNIGYGEGAVSDFFKTPLPGYPGSPSHIVARNVTDNSAVVCWTESAIGMPFTLYSIEISESDAIERAKIIRLSSIGPVPSVPGCSTGAMITDLHPDTCYTFLVYVTNNQGVGQPSPTSDQYCTLPKLTGITGTPLILKREFIAGVVVGSVLLIAVLVVLSFCIVMRQWKKSTLKLNMHIPNTTNTTNTTNHCPSYGPRRDSENSVQSTTVLLDYNRKASLFSCSSTMSDSPESSQDTPTTSTTIFPDGEHKNPFDFSRGVISNNPSLVHPQPVLCPKTANSMDYPPGSTRNGSVLEKRFPIYPILEHPPPYPHQPLSCTTMPPPLLSQPPPPRGYHQSRCYPPRSAFPNPMGEEVVMTENPNFEEERALGRGACMWYRAHPEHSALQSYQGDCMSEVESEISVPFQIPTPHFGESYSSSGYSPVLPRSQSSTRSFSGGGDGGGVIPNTVVKSQSGTSNGSYQNVTVQITKPCDDDDDDDDDDDGDGDDGDDDDGDGDGDGDGDEDTEFVDNDAYVTFSSPRFEISDSKRGDIYETVQIKQQ